MLRLFLQAAGSYALPAKPRPLLYFPWNTGKDAAAAAHAPQCRLQQDPTPAVRNTRNASLPGI